MKRLRRRLALDLLLSVMLVFEMFFQVTGDFLHEIVGIAFFVTIAVHLALSHKWIGATKQSVQQGKKLKMSNWLRMIVGIAMGIDMLVLIASSIAISNLLLSAGVNIAANTYSTWSIIHTASAYALACLVVGHLLIHWASVAAVFKIPYNPERRSAINIGMTAVVAIGTASIGSVGASRVNEMAQASKTRNTDTENGSDAGSSVGESGSAYADTYEHHHRHGHGNGRFDSQGDSGEFWNNSSSNDRSESWSDSDASSDSSDTNSSDSDSSSDSASGTCTLCHKYCPLSAPQCNRPYEAGLL